MASIVAICSGDKPILFNASNGIDDIPLEIGLIIINQIINGNTGSGWYHGKRAVGWSWSAGWRPIRQTKSTDRKIASESILIGHHLSHVFIAFCWLVLISETIRSVVI